MKNGSHRSDSGAESTLNLINALLVKYVFVYVPIDLPVVDWKLETDIRKKRLLNYSIDFGICIFVAIALNIVQQIVYQ
ncbi:unnamed protein product [Camellia sinensis]